MEVIGIKFDKTPKVYYFAAEDGVEYEVGKAVVVDTARGQEIARIALGKQDVPDDKLVQPVKKIARIASDEDLERVAANIAKIPSTLATIRAQVADSGLKMKITDAEYAFDGSKLVVYFTAESRVDFRELVRELAGLFRMRIELRQIGARDECRMKGGLSPCGRACCCSDHVSEFEHVTIKMAKTQGLSLNPGKISGLCGRLMCCLAYENEYYAQVNKRMPKMGSAVKLTDGREGIAIGLNQLKETVRLKIGKDESVEIVDVGMSDIVSKGANSEDDGAEEKIDDDLKELLD